MIATNRIANVLDQKEKEEDENDTLEEEGEGWTEKDGWEDDEKNK
jgi:hypothetical protein